ncbi:serine/threonine-protein kinase [Chloropicon primus]|uniref:non-specific serine/threonine protein kinase n=1 Tax=Chloropicon primus TaxID=1764295 RepID=A0A5B8MN09_9CHLO|nr:serine/threonine-protein kinase [Chloropicon primus]UPR00893.1 serine/threonine-protein kinase [Chloropicon primus]|mmetsp:Transcript_12111/g.33565  ORF Transcript_12111/g.33565 Transcript_12111/m.33565 type:complete len:503 (+) Transcript_12111:87-1595(+)|eukprot:QDZ21671.1 serine/threonine-protein kinase [Chloropicon primus]
MASHHRSRYREEQRLREGEHVKQGQWELRINKTLGEGNFAIVYDCVSVRDPLARQGTRFALKFEKFEGGGELKKDEALLSALRETGVVPKIVCQGTHRGNSFIVMTKGGMNLHDFRDKRIKREYICDKALHQVDVKLVYALGYCMLWALKKMHACGYVHRDVKLANFLLDHDEASDTARVSLIDFGLSKLYRREDGTHVEERPPDLSKFRGTTSFASPNAHDFKDLSRRDDLWSLVYILIELYSGTLPWRLGNKAEDRSKVKEETRKLKVKLAASEFYQYFQSADGSDKYCFNFSQNAGVAKGKSRLDIIQLKRLHDMARDLKYDEEPKYDELLNRFKGECGGLLKLDRFGEPTVVNLSAFLLPKHHGHNRREAHQGPSSTSAHGVGLTNHSRGGTSEQAQKRGRDQGGGAAHQKRRRLEEVSPAAKPANDEIEERLRQQPTVFKRRVELMQTCISDCVTEDMFNMFMHSYLKEQIPKRGGKYARNLLVNFLATWCDAMDKL